MVKKLLTWSVDKDPKLRNARNSQNRIAFNIAKNPETKLGFRIIWSSARDGDLDMVRILLREGQEIDEQTQELRNTSLHLACQNGHFLIVRLLVESGAERQVTNKAGKTPLQLAEEAYKANLGPKRRGGKPAPIVKGSIQDRLQAILVFLYEKENRNWHEEQKAAAPK